MYLTIYTIQNNPFNIFYCGIKVLYKNELVGKGQPLGREPE